MKSSHEFKELPGRERVPSGQLTEALEAPVRKLKIEAEGDFFRGLTKPKIRLTGRWLERAGFRPGSHVHVICVAPGVIELRSSEVSTPKRAF